MEYEISCEWKGGMAFDAEVNGHHIMLDAKKEVGGEDKGPRPKPLVLTALAGCTGMDVASLLKKMRVKVDNLKIDVKGQMTEEHPKYYDKIHVTYTVSGKDVDKKKFEKAVNLSQERYCGVSEMVRQFADLTYEVVYEG